ncbi:MAG: outer spore coat protein CotE [Bacilli bacterium]|nr:outer spore coat protein CotE [Bacilli bacterium]
MSEIREIVTRAVVCKGKKTIRINTTVPLTDTANKILGCFVTANQISTELLNEKVKVNGNFEINIWYLTENSNTTNVTKSSLTYEDTIKVRKIICDVIGNNLSVVTSLLQEPTCMNAEICNDGIKVEVLLEVLAEVIGETKMMVTTFACQETNDAFDDFENEINEDFLNEEG